MVIRRKQSIIAKMKSSFKRLIKKLVPQELKFLVRQFRGSADEAEVICTICNSSYSNFAPFGAPVRKNARCLKCGSLERHRLMWKYLQDRTDFFQKKNIRVLHFAPEKFFFEKLTSLSNVHYTPCDLFPEVYTYDIHRKIIKVDITKIPFEENTFDVIICNHVLEHIPNDRLAMTELLRVMKKGGWGIFQVPIDYKRENTYEDFTITTPEGRLAAFGQSDHVRWYGRDYKDRLASAGLIVKEDDYIRNFSSHEIVKYGFQTNELIYYCKKE